MQESATAVKDSTQNIEKQMKEQLLSNLVISGIEQFLSKLVIHGVNQLFSHIGQKSNYIYKSFVHIIDTSQTYNMSKFQVIITLIVNIIDKKHYTVNISIHDFS